MWEPWGLREGLIPGSPEGLRKGLVPGRTELWQEAPLLPEVGGTLGACHSLSVSEQSGRKFEVIVEHMRRRQIWKLCEARAGVCERGEEEAPVKHWIKSHHQKAGTSRMFF